MVVRRLEADAISQLKEAVPEKFRRLESSALFEQVKELQDNMQTDLNPDASSQNEVRYM
jgi:hypothetical protein